MFQSLRSLPQLLPATAYTDPAVLDEERQTLFLPAWHFVAPASDFAQPAAYQTTTLLGHSLILWRSDDRIRCFLNVCPHRFTQVADGCGAATSLRCPYHGWEFAADGRSRKIPEASLFRPLNDSPTALREFPLVETHGLLFVNLAPGATRADFRTPPMFETLFPATLQPVHLWSFRVAANWKLVVENAVESYHVESVHTQTFKVAPRPEMCQHSFATDSTGFTSQEVPAGFWQRLADAWAYPLMGLSQDLTYHQHLIYPNLMVGKAGLFSWVHTVLPHTADSSEVRLQFYMQRPSRRNPLAQAVAAAFRRGAIRFTGTATAEDAAILPKVQAGLSSPTFPATGVLSIREERIHHFQHWWRGAMGDPADDTEPPHSTEPLRRPAAHADQALRASG